MPRERLAFAALRDERHVGGVPLARAQVHPDVQLKSALISAFSRVERGWRGIWERRDVVLYPHHHRQTRAWSAFARR